MKNSTIKHYNDHAQIYYDTTVSVDMGTLYNPFLSYLAPKSKILDAGCGSGRDSYFFKQRGFEVTAFDASENMVALSSELIGEKVLLMTFEDLSLSEHYDGIWACASLLHVAKEDLASIITRLSNHLNDGGVFYMSFKYGKGDFWQDGRYFNCHDEESLRKLIEEIPQLEIKELFITTDVRKEHNEQRWLNAFIIKRTSS